MSGGDETKVDVPNLGAQSPKFSALAAKLQSSTQTLISSADGEGEPWGADDLGQAFANGYSPARETEGTNAGAHVDHLNRLAGVTSAFAKGFGGQEDGNTCSFGGE